MNSKKIRYLLVLFLYGLLIDYLVLHTPFKVFDVKGVDAVNTVLAFKYPSGQPSDLVLPVQLDESTAREIRLPDDWSQHTDDSKERWYRAMVEIENVAKSVWAVYLPSVTHNAAVYVNGVWVGQGGAFTEPVSRHHNNPLLFKFSSSLVKEGNNQIDIRVRASYHSQGLMDQFYMAPLVALQEAYNWKHFLRVEFIQWVSVAMYIIGLIVLCFWFARPQDGIYALFSLQLFIWATHNLNLFIFDIPTTANFWEAMTMSTLGWTVVAMIFFNHRYVGEANRKVEISALVFAVLGLGIFALPDIGLILTLGYGVWDVFLILFGSYAIIHLLRVYWLRQELDVYLMLLVGIPILVFGLHDILVVNHFRDRREGLTIQYSVIPAILLFSYFLMKRFVQSVNHAEDLAATLEQRVQEKQRALLSQHEQLKEMERQQMLSDERERIMRDMHDGIGGQLVSVISSLQERGGVYAQVRDKVQLSMNDLRSMIDSLDSELNDLTSLMGAMRTRLEDQLSASGIALDWAITDLPSHEKLSPNRSLHIMRIIQEVVTNSIKHSGTKRFKVETYFDDDTIYIRLTDCGKGFAADEMMEKGRGIKNIRYRASQIKAGLEYETCFATYNPALSKRGVSVTLKLAR